MKNKLISTFLVITFILTCVLNISAINPQPEPPIGIYIDGKLLKSDTSAYIKNNRVFVPMRAIFEALQCTVEWFAEEGMIVAMDSNNRSIKLKIGADQVFKNGLIASKIDTKPEIVNGRTMVPLRFVAEALGAKVEWVSEKRRVEVLYLTANDYAEKESSKIDLSKVSLSSKDYDFQIINSPAKISQKELVDVLLNTNVALDYSNYLTFTENQDGWGGCIGRSITHCISIIKEIEHPYTPDLSFSYLGYWFEKERNDYLAAHPNASSDTWPNFTINNLKDKGIASEGLYPSDFDGLNLKSGVNSEGKAYQYYDLTDLTPPTNYINQEASLYKTKMTDARGIDYTTAKYYMKTFGPIAGYGFGKVDGNANRQANIFLKNHCVTFIGYDDNHDNGNGNKGAFKILNSWGDTWNGNGFTWLPYSAFSDCFGGVGYFENIPSDRTNTNDAYSMRIRIKHPGGRNRLTISVGVLGEEPVVIWDKFNDQWDKCYDDSKNLNIDVPLPAYASKHWPPSNSNKWYVDVKNTLLPLPNDATYNESIKAEITEVTMAKLIKNPVGIFSTNKYSSEISKTFVEASETVRAFVPAMQGYELTLSPEVSKAKSGDTIHLNGNLIAQKFCTSVNTSPGQNPIANKDITIFEIVKNLGSSTYYWTLKGVVKTDAQGAYAMDLVANKNAKYVATLMEEDFSDAVVSSKAVELIILLDIHKEIIDGTQINSDISSIVAPTPTPEAIKIPSFNTLKQIQIQSTVNKDLSSNTSIKLANTPTPTPTPTPTAIPIPIPAVVPNVTLENKITILTPTPTPVPTTTPSPQPLSPINLQPRLPVVTPTPTPIIKSIRVN